MWVGGGGGGVKEEKLKTFFKMCRAREVTQLPHLNVIHMRNSTAFFTLHGVITAQDLVLHGNLQET